MPTIQNLNQVRACHALSFAREHRVFDQELRAYVTTIEGENGGDVVKKIPPAIMNNGLLSALAYSMETKIDKKTREEKHHPWRAVFDGIANHLSSREIAIVPLSANNAEQLLTYLVDGDTSSAKLREATDEAMLWLEFARRFV